MLYRLTCSTISIEPFSQLRFPCFGWLYKTRQCNILKMSPKADYTRAQWTANFPGSQNPLPRECLYYFGVFSTTLLVKDLHPLFQQGPWKCIYFVGWDSTLIEPSLYPSNLWIVFRILQQPCKTFDVCWSDWIGFSRSSFCWKPCKSK